MNNDHKGDVAKGWGDISRMTLILIEGHLDNGLNATSSFLSLNLFSQALKVVLLNTIC